ncbi:MAG: excinuclease ABC subunit UvrA [Deltaproteobacteria bacterium]|nr:excinuclease ABC subunit UvrA [Deltaproteobacteria bacterium]
MEPDTIRIRGARMHNLKNIDVDLPRNRLIVFTGLSGSGKSSLAFDTLYAEGQRRYVESLSTYARQFLGQMDKPDVDSLEGLSPAVSIEQRTTSRNPRSTVGTITEIYDYLRLLFARVGHQHCPDCGQEIRPQSIEAMVDILLSMAEGTKCVLLAPLVDARKGEHVELLNKLRKEGFVRVRIDGEMRGLDEKIELAKTKRHTIEAVVDRIIIKPAARQRLAQSTATAVQLTEGFLLASFPDTNSEKLFSERAACVHCGTSLLDLSPQLFSFNNPKGACEECGGLGVKHFFDPHLVIPDPTLTLRQGAIAPWRYRSSSSYASQLLNALAKHHSFNLDTSFAKLPEKAKNVILYGTGGEPVSFHYESRNRTLTSQTPFEGILPQLSRLYLETTSSSTRDELVLYMNEQPCPSCHGARLKPAALSVRVGRWAVHELTALSIIQLAAALPQVSLSQQEQFIAQPIIREIQNRLTFLLDVGLGYLSLNRTAGTLSGGEAQRIRLASQIGSRLVGVLYILDEPSIGLHQRDNERLIRTLTSLRDIGNTVIVVEHDSETIAAADHVLDIGPGAGVHGGRVIYNGPVAGLLAEEESLTGGFLSGRLEIPVPETRRSPRSKKEWLRLSGATAHNLKTVKADFPLGLMTCVTGVSGSGKSSLVMECLFKGAREGLGQSRHAGSGQYDFIKGLDKIDSVIDIDQSPIGRTPRSNPATYTGVLTPIRELLARLPESRARGYKEGRFSFNVKGGRCEACEGDGVIKIAMHFLPDVYVTCETCNGKRYNQETLEITYRSKNISEILAMTVEEALQFFTNIPAIKNRLQALFDVGLSYISLGQSSVTLSGGEAQRIKLARELRKRSTGKTLYILDEPTTGLHPADIQHLLSVLSRLVDQGNTAVIIEHNLDVIKTADYIIDLGPEGGDEGGSIVAMGPPEKIARTPASYTGMFLKQILNELNA